MSTNEETHAAAILAALDAALYPKRAYDVDEIPDPRPSEYVEFTLSWRFGGERRMDGYVATDGHRITTRYVASSVSNARLMREKVRGVLDFGAVAIGAEVAFTNRETAEPIGPDEGAFSGYDQWTYTV